MKRIVSLIVLVFTLFLSTQSLVAQEQTPEEFAKAKATEMQTQFNLDENQKATIYRAFYAKELNYRKHINGKEDDPNYARNKNKIDTSFDHILKKTLGEEKFNVYKASLNN